MKIGLVLEGGGMRGLYTNGVLDCMMDNDWYPDYVIGVSAGALCGYNYVAGAVGRSCFLNVKYCDDWRYLSLKSFARTGNAYGREFAFDRIPNELEPFDAAAEEKKAAFKEEGIAYTIRQIDEYRACGIDGIHLYALNKYEDVARIAREAGLLDEI